jgi:histidyl-tRNA synthetase
MNPYESTRSMQKIQGIRGMNDCLPDQSKQWLFLEALLRLCMKRHGYQHIRMPVVEQKNLFVRSVGDVTDIVEKEMYHFTDHLNGDELVLRPEGTASCVRSVIQHNLLYHAAPRLWYMGPMFRHERPQKGRYRQFHQLGVEAFGRDDPIVEAEQIAMLSDLWGMLALKDLRLEINTIGDVQEREHYKKDLISYFEKHLEVLDQDSKNRLYKNPLRILDSKNSEMRALIEQAPKMHSYFGEATLRHHAKWKSYLDALNISYVENPYLVRGLDYYNRSVFEWVSDHLGAQGTVVAGGRYDGLVEHLGGASTPAVGFALGIERLLLEIEAQNPSLLDVKDAPDVYLIHHGEGTSIYALALATRLRQEGFSVFVHGQESQSFKSQMKKADQSGANIVGIIGEDELKKNLVVLKSLSDGSQQTCSWDDFINELKRMHHYGIES